MVAAKSTNNDVDTSSWVTRNQAADLIGVSHTTIKNWDGVHLHPRKARRPLPNGGFREVWVYDTDELSKIPSGLRQRARAMPGGQGEIAARAFEMFDEGHPLRRVVISLRETPEAVEVLHDQWMRLGGADVVVGPAARAEIERLLGPFDGVAGLVERIRELTCPAAAPTPVATDAAAGASPHIK